MHLQTLGLLLGRFDPKNGYEKIKSKLIPTKKLSHMTLMHSNFFQKIWKINSSQEKSCEKKVVPIRV